MKEEKIQKLDIFFYLQSTLTLILFDTVGGTLFDAAEKQKKKKKTHK